LILAGETLFAGGDDLVVAFDAATGTKRWSAPVTGKAHGLAVAHGRLFVSTDRGTIHCFRAGAGG
jgi:outer membrane protein assembly factor BamB